MGDSSSKEGSDEKNIDNRTEASDRTAAGVAKIRHIETILNVEGDEARLFEDAYAEYFYTGSSVVNMLCGKWFMNTVSNDRDLAMVYLLTGRTREFDERVRAAARAAIKQIVILGAGYDTRGFRLDLPDDVLIFEVDQPDVQAKKKAGLEAIKQAGLELRNEQNVHFVPCDFNVEDITKLKDVPKYNPSVATLFTLEGVTQYIPKEATSSTLKAAGSVCGSGSQFVISYVPQDLYDAPEKVFDPQSIKELLSKVESMGEPWISGWNQNEFASFMRQNGFKVQRDISIEELIKEYYQPASRQVPENQQAMFERYAWATKG